MNQDEIVRRARSLVGIAFRPQGRDPLAALDCVGVVVSVFELPVETVPRNYRLRGRFADTMEDELWRHFRRVPVGERGAADVMLCAIRADRLHLAIHCGGSFVHADARARRVVETPGDPPWPLRSVFRRLDDFRAS